MTYIIIDFEATCCNQNSIMRSEMEIIEIGAVAVDRDTLEIVSEYNTFIKPKLYTKLTSFCKELTTISQEDTDSAPKFPLGLTRFTEWCAEFSNKIYCSWGDYDKKQWSQDCKLHNLQSDLFDVHINIKKEFSDVQKLKKKLGMKSALNKASIELQGTHHRGIDDAKNMSKLLPYIFGNKTL